MSFNALNSSDLSTSSSSGLTNPAQTPNQIVEGLLNQINSLAQQLPGESDLDQQYKTMKQIKEAYLQIESQTPSVNVNNREEYAATISSLGSAIETVNDQITYEEALSVNLVSDAVSACSQQLNQ